MALPKRLRDIIKQDWSSDFRDKRGKLRSTKGYVRKLKAIKKDLYHRDYDKAENDPDRDQHVH